MTSAGAYLPLVVDGITKIMNFISRQKEKEAKQEGRLTGPENKTISPAKI